MKVRQRLVYDFGPFSLKDNLDNYDLVVYLGKCNSLTIILKCHQLLEIVVNECTKQLIFADKELRKRVH